MGHEQLHAFAAAVYALTGGFEERPQQIKERKKAPKKIRKRRKAERQRRRKARRK